MKGLKILSLAVSFIFITGLFLYSKANIYQTSHNLSIYGPGVIKAVSEKRICVFCHTPHNASPSVPLCNRDISYQSGIVYQPYTSPTLDSTPGQPTGASKLCLSCHDGTVAVGQLLYRSVQMTDSGSGRLTPDGKISSGDQYGYIGTDLTGHHPVSMKVTTAIINQNNANGDYPLNPINNMKNDPDGVRLDMNDEVQCTSCHDPHDDTNRGTAFAPFWRKPTWSGVCTVCHQY